MVPAWSCGGTILCQAPRFQIWVPAEPCTRQNQRDEQVTERIARVPVDLFRYEILMTLRPVSDEAIEEIVDTIFLPLLEARRP